MRRLQFWQLGIAAVLSAALAASVIAFYRASAAAADIAAARESRMFQSPQKGSFARFQRGVFATPLQADLVHGMIAHQVYQRGARSLTAAERDALLSLGWRSTLVQTALLLDSVRRVDDQLALSRIDGMLRRSVQKPELLNLLIRLEQAGPVPRREIARLLAARPNWRTDFMRLPAGYSSAAGVQARAETLDAMFARRLAPKRDEVAPIVNSLEASGDTERAERLWRQFHNIGTKVPLPFDPRFVVMAADPLDGQYQPMAYEWRGGHGAGYSARVSLIDPDNAVMAIRWDGRGAPVLLRQRLIAAPGRFAVTVKGSLLDRNALQRLAFVFYCGGAAPVFHDRVSQEANGAFVFTANEPVSCRSPEIRLVGMSTESAKPLELEINSIRIEYFGDARPLGEGERRIPTLTIRTSK